MSVSLLIQVLVLGFLSVAATEFLLWQRVYNKPQYKEVSDQIKKYSEMVKKLRSEVDPSATDKKSIRAQKLLESNELHLRSLQMSQMRDNMMLSFVNIFSLMFGYYLMSILGYDGIVICRLPFVPFSFMRALTHRGLDPLPQEDGTSIQLDEDEYRNASVYFIYGLALVVFRQVVQKLMERYKLKPIAPQVSIFDTANAQNINSWDDLKKLK